MSGIPATGNKLDISGTTIVLMKDGKVLREQDFFDNHSFNAAWSTIVDLHIKFKT